MIPITKPFLPPLKEYQSFLEQIWLNQWLTNMGPLSKELEKQLASHLKINDILFVTNGTIALQMAIKALGLKGEIITTPFSFVATTSSIVWEGCKPIFVDIDKNTLNIDATKIEAAITEHTSAILATHVYGNPCDVLAIESIAKKHNLKVIYDGAHAFGVEVYNKSIFEYGDISICSLHATKLYHSTEGGLIIANEPKLLKKLVYIRNFGFDGPEAFAELGINGKNSEFHAAMGLANFPYINTIHLKRKKLTEIYDLNLNELNAKKPLWHKQGSINYSYYPLIFQTEESMLKAKTYLEKHDIFSRRYFYPSLSNVLPYIKDKKMPITDEISKKVLCLPLYYDLTVNEVEMICECLITIQNN
jgi:dTDP-4-amino-4,6-dideoxygalactose transaminase